MTEVNLNRSSSTTLAPTKASDLKHNFTTHYGGKYSVVVKTTGPKAVPSQPEYYDAPEILPPHQVQVLPELNHSYVVFWKENDMPKAIQESS